MTLTHIGKLSGHDSGDFPETHLGQIDVGDYFGMLVTDLIHEKITNIMKKSATR